MKHSLKNHRKNCLNNRLNNRPHVIAEPLESRTLLSGGPLILNGTDGPDTIEVYYTRLAQGNFTYNYNVNGVGGSFFNVTPDKIVINGKGGNDKITMFSLPFTVTYINGGAGDDTISLPGVGQIYNTTVDGGTGDNTLLANMNPGWNSESYNGRFTDSYQVTDTTLQRFVYDSITTLTNPNAPVIYSNIQTLTFKTNPKSATIDVRSLAKNCTTTIIASASNNVFNIGDGNFNDNLLGHLILNGNGGADTINFNDLLTFDNASYNLGATYLYKSGLPIVDFTGMQTINLTANAGNNGISINAVAANQTVTVNGWGGDDHFYVGARNYAANIAGKLTLSGGPGANNQVQFDDQDDLGADTYTLTPTTFTKTGQKYPTTFSNMQIASIAGNMDPNTFDITPSTQTRFVAYGRGPAFVGNGDLLRLHVDNVKNPVKTMTLPGTGYYAFANRQTVSFNGIEQFALVGSPITMLHLTPGVFATTKPSTRATLFYAPDDILTTQSH